MKKASIILGLITALLITTAMAFKMNHLPGAGTLLLCTGLILSLYYSMYVIDVLNEKYSNNGLAVKMTTAVCIICTEVGVTFRIHHWPLADALLVTGLAGFSFILVPQLFLLKLREDNRDIFRNVSGALALSCFGMGTLCKLEEWPGAEVLLTIVPVLLLIYFVRYIRDLSISAPVKNEYLRSAFMVIVVVAIISLYFVKSIEIHDQQMVAADEDQQIVAVR